jgi:hypothetical protein
MNSLPALGRHVTIKNQIIYTRIDNNNNLKWLFDVAN